MPGHKRYVTPDGPETNGSYSEDFSSFYECTHLNVTASSQISVEEAPVIRTARIQAPCIKCVLHILRRASRSSLNVL